MPILSIRISAELHKRFLAECERRDLKPAEFQAIVDRMAEADLTVTPRAPVKQIAAPQVHADTLHVAAPFGPVKRASPKPDKGRK